MANELVVVAEHDGVQPTPATINVLNVARKLADELGVELAVVVLGDQLEKVVRTFQDMKVEQIQVVEHMDLKWNWGIQTANVLKGILSDIQPRAVLLGYNYHSIEVGPALAVRLGWTFISNCLDLRLLGGKWIITRQIYGGLRHAKIELECDRPAIFSLYLLGTNHSEWAQTGPARVVRYSADDNTKVEKARILDVLNPVSSGVDITKADILIGVGRGIGSKANLLLIEELAKQLGAMIACTRALSDSGWLPSEHLVGISGKTVTPKVYIACGISGAAQHIAGMSGSRRIIAINKDPSAPIFQVAHYAIVGDLLETLRSLIEEAKRKRQVASS